MDACWMAAQLLTTCITHESTLAPFQPQPENQAGAATAPTRLPSASACPSRGPEQVAQPLLTPITSPLATTGLSLNLTAAAEPIEVFSCPQPNRAGPSQSWFSPALPDLSAGVGRTLVDLSPNPPRPDQTQVYPHWASAPRPLNGSQMYRFRLASLQAGKLYNRVSPQRYQSTWQTAPVHPTHQDWQTLLRQEAAVMARAQGPNRLSIVLGDSLSLWLPAELLPHQQFWLNQGIAGETTAQILKRLPDFAPTRPDRIHLMAGINDLKQGASDRQILSNFQHIVERLKQQHPQAQIVVYSILPTRWQSLPGDRIRSLNRSLSHLASQGGGSFVDLQPAFQDQHGQLRRELTTDGLHLAPQGYELWRTALVSYDHLI
ncbi:MAG: hypothetical protein KGQ93_10020 [Cyanobacteria bacterium REEB459]|nr:hypothetical protein [Cyanobacteria bacterium REEB459]